MRKVFFGIMAALSFVADASAQQAKTGFIYPAVIAVTKGETSSCMLPVLGCFHYGAFYYAMDTFPNKNLKGFFMFTDRYGGPNIPVLMWDDVHLHLYWLDFNQDIYLSKKDSLYFPGILKAASIPFVSLMTITVDSLSGNYRYSFFNERTLILNADTLLDINPIAVSSHYSANFSYFDILGTNSANEIVYVKIFVEPRLNINGPFLLSGIANVEEVFFENGIVGIISSPGDSQVLYTEFNSSANSISTKMLYQHSGARKASIGYEEILFQPMLDTSADSLHLQVLRYDKETDSISVISLNDTLVFVKSVRSLVSESPFLGTPSANLVNHTIPAPVFALEGQVFWIVSVPKHENPLALHLYPNPANDYVTIKLEGQNLPQSSVYEIVSMSGAIITKGEFITNIETKISLADIPKGIYLLRIANNEGVAVKKFIKE